MQQHNITPPPELVHQWVAEIWHEGTPVRVSLSDEHIATRAAQWGADQELEACRQWLEINGAPRELIGGLLVARCCTEPPSLKEQALKVLSETELRHEWTAADEDIIRRALEQLPDHE